MNDEIFDVACRMAQELQEHVDLAEDVGKPCDAAKALLEDWHRVVHEFMAEVPQ